MTDPVQQVDQEDQDDLAELQLAIAEQIALLSQVEETPSEFDPPGMELDSSDVDLRASSWMTHLASVQGWLRLSEDLNLADPHSFFRSLAIGLGSVEDESVLALTSGTPRLSPAGLDLLNGRLQRALQLQREFVADLETEGSSVASATGRWVESWEEEDDADADDGGDPVTAKAGIWSINDFSDRAGDDELNLSPSYQRGDVWPTTDSQMLIESILRGIPLPSVIILKPGEGQPYEVVDGKQRLTSILRFIGKHPSALEKVGQTNASYLATPSLSVLFETDYPRFRRAWKNHTGEQLTAAIEREYYFPFKLRTGSSALRGHLQRLKGRYYTEITEERVMIADRSVKVRQLFEKATDYKIPLIEYSKATPRQIHEVFNLYNRQGKHLNAEEIRNAVYHEVKLMRALLVAAGDNPSIEVAPFLEPDWIGGLQGLGEMLSAYGFGTARYRRTKVLSWLASLVFLDSSGPKGPKRLSTARNTDALLQRIEDDPHDPLQDEGNIRAALGLLSDGIEAHSAIDEAWAPRFRDTSSGAKWQELQLVGSLLGVTIAAVVLGPDTADRLADVAAQLREVTDSEAWQRPTKTQTATQWSYIAGRALDISGLMGVDAELASMTMIKRFGYSSVPTLQAVR